MPAVGVLGRPTDIVLSPDSSASITGAPGNSSTSSGGSSITVSDNSTVRIADNSTTTFSASASVTTGVSANLTSSASTDCDRCQKCRRPVSKVQATVPTTTAAAAGKERPAEGKSTANKARTATNKDGAGRI